MFRVQTNYRPTIAEPIRSPDGTIIGYFMPNGEARIDATSSKHHPKISEPVVAPDGTILAFIGPDGSVRQASDTWGIHGVAGTNPRSTQSVVNNNKDKIETVQQPAKQTAGTVSKNIQQPEEQSIAKLRGADNKVIADVWAGKYGTGEARKKALTAAGYNADAVQTAINNSEKGKAEVTQKKQVSNKAADNNVSNKVAPVKTTPAKGNIVKVAPVKTTSAKDNVSPLVIWQRQNPNLARQIYQQLYSNGQEAQYPSVIKDIMQRGAYSDEDIASAGDKADYYRNLNGLTGRDRLRAIQAQYGLSDISGKWYTDRMMARNLNRFNNRQADKQFINQNIIDSVDDNIGTR
jgi:phosphopantetheinyl transferase (holo-ACP synthase)